MEKSMAVLFLILTFVVARIVSTRALRRLSTHQKGQVVEAFANGGIYSLLPMAFLGACLIGLPALGLNLTNILGPFLLGNVIFVGLMLLPIHRKLKALELPKEYVRAVLISRALVFAGVLGLAAPFLLE